MSLFHYFNNANKYYFMWHRWKRKWQPTPVFLPGESHGWRSLVGYSPRGCKESDTTERLSFFLSKHLRLGGMESLLFLLEGRFVIIHTHVVAQNAKNLPAGDLGSISGLGRSPGEGKGSPLQYSCLENPMDRGAWWATVRRLKCLSTRMHGITKC